MGIHQLWSILRKGTTSLKVLSLNRDTSCVEPVGRLVLRHHLLSSHSEVELRAARLDRLKLFKSFSVEARPVEHQFLHVAVDANYFCYRLALGIKLDQCELRKEAAQRLEEETTRWIRFLRNHLLEPIFVFDGFEKKLKERTLKIRRDVINEAKKKAEGSKQRMDGIRKKEAGVLLAMAPEIDISLADVPISWNSASIEDAVRVGDSENEDANEDSDAEVEKKLEAAIERSRLMRERGKRAKPTIDANVNRVRNQVESVIKKFVRKTGASEAVAKVVQNRVERASLIRVAKAARSLSRKKKHSTAEITAECGEELNAVAIEVMQELADDLLNRSNSAVKDLELQIEEEGVKLKKSRRAAFRLGNIHFKSVQRSIRNAGAEFIYAPSDGESQCAIMADRENGFVDAVVSNDADAIAFGSPITISGMYEAYSAPPKGPKRTVSIAHLKSLMEQLGASNRRDLVEAFVHFLPTDYSSPRGNLTGGAHIRQKFKHFFSTRGTLKPPEDHSRAADFFMCPPAINFLECCGQRALQNHSHYGKRDQLAALARTLADLSSIVHSVDNDAFLAFADQLFLEQSRIAD